MKRGTANAENMKYITSTLPEGWEAKAKETKAFQRRGDYIQTPEDLLRILLLWSELGTFGLTSAFLRTNGNIPLNKNAVYERVLKSEEWLKWLVANYCHEHNYLATPPKWIASYRVLTVDASNVSKPGSKGADYRLHYMTELFSLTLSEQHLTSASVGESMTNFTGFQKNDLVVADRAYGTLKSIEWVMEHGASYVFRMKANAFNLYAKTETGSFEAFDLAHVLTDWAPGKVVDNLLYYKRGNEYFPIRVCAIGKTEEAIKKGTSRIKKSNYSNKRTEISELQSIFNRFIVVVTNLPSEISAERILELYRMRWQVELVFKRLKSIMKYDELLAKKHGN